MMGEDALPSVLDASHSYILHSKIKAHLGRHTPLLIATSLIRIQTMKAFDKISYMSHSRCPDRPGRSNQV